MDRRRITTAAAVAVALATAPAWSPSGAAWAQNAAASTPSTAAAPASSATPAATGGQLQEVVITAERRATNVQATPIAVTAVTGTQLQEQHLATISSLQTTVPSFQSQQTGGGFFNSINIRGIGNSAITPIIATGVAVFRDGLLMSETIAEDSALYDIHDTEVLEGPQGTFVGASSTAGAVEITTNDPMIGRGIHGYLLGQIGDYSDTELQGAVNLPVSSTFAARIAFDSIHKNSYSKNLGSILSPGASRPITDPGHHWERDVRLSLLWQPSSSYQALAKIEYSFIDRGEADELPNPQTFTTFFSAGPQTGGLEAGCTLGGTLNADQVVCPLPGAVEHSQYWYPGETPRVLRYAPQNTNMELNYLVTHYGLRQDFLFANGVDLRSLTGFVHIDYNHIGNHSYSPANAGWTYHEIGPNDNYYSEELDLVSPTTGPFFSKYNWIVGGFWNYRDTPVYIDSVSVPSPYGEGLVPNTNVFNGFGAVNRIAAVFGQFNWQFTKTLQLQVGARQNWDNNFAYGDPGPSAAPRFVPQPHPTGNGVYHVSYDAAGVPSYSLIVPLSSGGHYNDSVPTGKIDLNWTPAPGQNFYVFYARGYKAGGTNESSSDHPTFDPEHVDDYELGWKGRLFNGRMLTQIGGYYYKYKGMQYELFDTVANNDQGTGNYVANLAPSTIYGFEFAEQARFGHFGIDVGFAWGKTKLGSVVALDSSRLPPGFGGPVSHPQCLPGHTYSANAPCFDYTPYLQNITGEQNPFAPTITGHVTVDYAFPIGNDVLQPRVTYSHTDKQYDSIFQNPYTLMGSRNLFNATIDFIAGQWDAQVYGTNLSNQLYIIGGGGNVNYGPPRQFGVRVTRNF